MPKPIARGFRWVGVANEQPVGFLPGLSQGKRFYIAEFAVARSHQRRGLGRRLIAVAEARARAIGADTWSLTTYRDLPWNEPFYHRLGFTEPSPLTPNLAEHLRQQAANGHGPGLRCGMVKPLT